MSLRHRALLVVVPLAAYASAIGNGFVWDDHRVIERGRLIESLRNVPVLFKHDTLYNSDGGWYEAREAAETLARAQNERGLQFVPPDLFGLIWLPPLQPFSLSR